jgi:hypothetical protein
MSRIGTVCLATMLLLLQACSGEQGPELVVERFIQTVNDRDLNNMLSCVDPKQERMLRVSFRLVERLTGGGLPVEDLLELLPGLYQLLRKDLDGDVILQDVQVYKARISGDESEVPVMLTASVRSTGKRKNEEVRLRFKLHRFEEGWRIVDIV